MPRSDQPRTLPPAAPPSRRGGGRPTTRPEASNIGLVRLQRQTVASMTLDAIRDGILHGHYAEGEPLRQDALADELGVSRIPIREALRQLETEGLVTFNPHRGAIVSSLSLEEIEEVFDLRASIESDLLRRAIPHLTTQQLDQADEVLERYAVALRTGEVAKWGVLNWQFHASLYAPAARPVTMNIVQRLHQQSDRYLRMQLALTHGETRATCACSSRSRTARRGRTRSTARSPPQRAPTIRSVHVSSSAITLPVQAARCSPFFASAASKTRMGVRPREHARPEVKNDNAHHTHVARRDRATTAAAVRRRGLGREHR